LALTVNQSSDSRLDALPGPGGSVKLPGFLPWRLIWLIALAAAAVPISLVWDFSWESTVGLDRLLAPAHTALYVAVAVTGLIAVRLVFLTTRSAAARGEGVQLGPCYAPLGAWIAAWGSLAYATGVTFDRWWQSAYGLAAGIWHPPQILNATAFFAVLFGAWLLCARWQNEPGVGRHRGGALLFVFVGGLVLALITVVTLTSILPNRQHSAWFYQLSCATYPIVLVALAVAGKIRWPVTMAALAYLIVMGAMVWLLPLFPAKPQSGPIYHPLDHLMPPPFPLLLVVPALAVDVLLRTLFWPAHRGRTWLQALIVGVAFFVAFIGTQWVFAEFLLTGDADNWFFAGGGRHWPFFLKIDPLARTAFWDTPRDSMSFGNTLTTAVLAVLAARIGLWLGAWLNRLQR
jgi:hypothetical protein